MSYITVLDYVFFQYWYVFANRYTVLNFHETGYLPGRYIASGLVGGAFVYWLYLIPTTLLKRYHPRYQHPRWWLLWMATASISSIQVMLIVRGSSTPPLSLSVALGLVAHLQVMHLIMLQVAERVLVRGEGTIIPRIRPALLLIVDWFFWLWYSFHVHPQGSPHPRVGSAFERYLLGLLALGLLVFGAMFWGGYKLPYLRRKQVVIAALNVQVGDVIACFYSAWALFYVTIPVIHYLLRGYVMAHDNLFPTYLLGALLPVGWSAVMLWVVMVIERPSMRRRLPQVARQWVGRLEIYYHQKK